MANATNNVEAVKAPGVIDYITQLCLSTARTKNELGAMALASKLFPDSTEIQLRRTAGVQVPSQSEDERGYQYDESIRQNGEYAGEKEYKLNPAKTETYLVSIMPKSGKFEDYPKALRAAVKKGLPWQVKNPALVKLGVKGRTPIQ